MKPGKIELYTSINIMHRLSTMLYGLSTKEFRSYHLNSLDDISLKLNIIDCYQKSASDAHTPSMWIGKSDANVDPDVMVPSV